MIPSSESWKIDVGEMEGWMEFEVRRIGNGEPRPRLIMVFALWDFGGIPVHALIHGPMVIRYRYHLSEFYTLSVE